MAILQGSTASWLPPRLPSHPANLLRLSSAFLLPSPPPPSLPAVSAPPAGRMPPWIRMMGGGPRTFPGGVTKWQWKRMQDRKARQLEKARLLRERQVYEMRRRAELLEAAAEVESPWGRRSRFRPASAVTADEQIKRLASRFDKSGAEDLWNDADGPVTFPGPRGELAARLLSPKTVRNTQLYREQAREGKAGKGEGKGKGCYSGSLASIPGKPKESKSASEKLQTCHRGNPPPLLLPWDDSSQLDFSGRQSRRSANVKHRGMQP